MVRSATSAAGLADRFFELSLLGLVSSGYLAILGSGFLDVPTAVLTAAGLLLRALLIVRVVRFTFSSRAVAAATGLYIAFYPIDYLYVSQDLLRTTVHLVCFLAVVKILTASTHRDYVFVKALAFLELLAAAVLSTNLSFFFFLALFLVFGVATFTSSEIRGSIRGPLWIARGGLRRFHPRLAALSLAIAMGILSLTAGFFFLLPRTANAAFRRLASQRYHLPGFSNEVRLGEIGEVLQQNTPVLHFRLRERNQPVHLKWRGAILSQFDGKRWFNVAAAGEILPVQKGMLILANDAQRRRQGARIHYEVQLRDIGSDALFFVGVPEVLWIDSPVVLRTPSGAYRLSSGTGEGLRYGASSFLEEASAEPVPELQPEVSKECLQLPPLDPRIAALARDVTAGYSTDQMRARVLENYLRTHYGYTLDLPSRSVADPIAYFLFERRKGHCEYFASAMAVMLRTLGIPARVVTGFQGGTFNPISGWYVVRASDAHSWVEGWLSGRGWTTFDPTPPDPVRRLASLWGRLYLYLDAADMFWQDWVVNYDLERQYVLATRMGDSGRGFGALWYDRLRLTGLRWKSLVAGWLREYGPLALVLLAVALLGRLYGPGAWQWCKARYKVKKVLSGRVQTADATVLYLRMLELLKRRGFQKPPWLTPAEFALLLPPSDTAMLVQDLTLAYNEFRYGGDREAAPRMTGLLERLERRR